MQKTERAWRGAIVPARAVGGCQVGYLPEQRAEDEAAPPQLVLLHSRKPVRVLIIEDDHRLATTLRRVLTEAGMSADVAYDGREGLEAAFAASYDVILLDLRLPLLNGRQVAQRLRERRVHTPILLLTALEPTDDEVASVSGIDDHLQKPFSRRELLAGIGALCRREPDVPADVLRAGQIVLDRVAHIVRAGDRRMELTPKEFAILEYLMSNPGRLLTKTAIIEHVWNYEFDCRSNLVEVYVRNLRRKLATAAAVDHIATVRGAGYRFEPAPERA
jgi:DNA-binding response OmpR family regulator